ncbi:MAG: hypothetical protein V9G12_12155, partial [Microthrixaceae bacterium]
MYGATRRHARGIRVTLPVGRLPDGRHQSPGGITDQDQRVGQLIGNRVQAPGPDAHNGVPQRLAGIREVLGRVTNRPPASRLIVLHEASCAAYGALDVDDGKLVGRRLGDAGGELVGFVDHHGVVVGDHRHAFDGVDRQQRVIGDDQVGTLCLLAGELDKTLRAEGTVRRAQTA